MAAAAASAVFAGIRRAELNQCCRRRRSWRSSRRTSRSDWLSPALQATYNYDAAGRLQSDVLAANTGITTTYGYDDPANYLTSVTNTQAGPPLTTLSSEAYLVNGNGDRTQVTDTTGMTTYGYDPLGRLANVTYPGPTTTQYTYDGNGNRLTTQVDANPATSYVSDAADQLTSVAGLPNGYNADGDLLLLGEGALSSDYQDSYLYDTADRPFRTGPCRSDVDDAQALSVGDSQMIFSRFKAGGHEGSDSYDVLVDATGGGVLSATEAQVAFADFKAGQRCTSTGPNTGNAHSTYNGDGLRVGLRTFPGGITTDDAFIWDQGASLPEILQDTQTQNGVSATTTYLYGLDGIVADTDGTGTTHEHLQDGLGSTTQLTDSAGAVTDSYTYDAFGAITSHTGTNPQPFTFTGQQEDTNAARGLLYLRARSYDPGLGRFVSQDPLPFLQRYAYADNDPENNFDPNGECLVARVCRLASDFGAVVTHTLLNPQDVFNGNLANEELAATIGALSSCQRKQKEGGVVVYTNCSGAASWLGGNVFGGPGAFTIGSFVFAPGIVSSDVLQHELAHVRQYDALGGGFIPTYEAAATGAFVSCNGDRRCTERRNPLEILADRQAGTNVR